MQPRWIVAVLLGSLFNAAAQEPNPVSKADVRLEAKDGKTQFYLGDVIRLELVFRDTAFPEQRDSLPPNKAWRPAPG